MALRVLVTGAGGFIGRVLVAHLLADGIEDARTSIAATVERLTKRGG